MIKLGPGDGREFWMTWVGPMELQGSSKAEKLQLQIWPGKDGQKDATSLALKTEGGFKPRSVSTQAGEGLHPEPPGGTLSLPTPWS